MSDLNEIERGQLCRTASDSFSSTGHGLSVFPGLLKKIIRFRAWERRELVTKDGNPKGRVIELSSLRELITEKPIKGWGEDPKKIEAVIKDDPECLAMFREAMVQHGGDRKSESIKCNNVTVDSGRLTGNSRAYSITRVQRECEPEIVAKVMAGEMSPNAALVKAGVRDNRQVYLPKEPAKAAEKLRQQFGNEFAQEMARVIVRELEASERAVLADWLQHGIE
jgi:hypothetical protein